MLKDPLIIEKHSYKMVGMSFFGDPFTNVTMWSEDNGIGQLWKRFGVWIQPNLHTLPTAMKENMVYEVHIKPDQMNESGGYEVFAGIQVEALDVIPVECVGKVLPQTQYAEFTLTGEEITSDWYSWIYEGWMPHSGYEPSSGYSIKVYNKIPEGFEHVKKASFKVLVPIRKVGDAK